MPRKTEEREGGQNQSFFDRQDWLAKAKEKVMQAPWGTAVMYDAEYLRLELVRIADSQDVMVRLCGQKTNNCVKMTRREHIQALLDIVSAIVENKNNLKDKLEAIAEALPSKTRVVEEI